MPRDVSVLREEARKRHEVAAFSVATFDMQRLIREVVAVGGEKTPLMKMLILDWYEEGFKILAQTDLCGSEEILQGLESGKLVFIPFAGPFFIEEGVGPMVSGLDGLRYGTEERDPEEEQFPFLDDNEIVGIACEKRGASYHFYLSLYLMPPNSMVVWFSHRDDMMEHFGPGITRHLSKYSHNTAINPVEGTA